MGIQDKPKFRKKTLSFFLSFSLLFNLLTPLTVVFAADSSSPTAPMLNSQQVTLGNQVSSSQDETWLDGVGDNVQSTVTPQAYQPVMPPHPQVMTYRITYILGDDGVNDPANPETYTYGVGVSSFKAPTRVGYDFLGWYNGEGECSSRLTHISEKEIGPKTLYARWSLAVYSIDYEPGSQGEFSNLPPRYVPFGMNTPDFNGPTDINGRPKGKTGYTFDGWSPSVQKNVTGEMTYVAQWRANQYDIVYYLDGGINAANPLTYTYGIGVNDFEVPTKIGHTFLGWYDLAEDGKEITSISTTATDKHHLFAYWNANDYEITYELDGGVNVATNPNGYTYGVGVTSFEPATKIGYTFLGWFDKASGGTEITSLSRTESANKTLYAHWKANNYEITYELDGGVNVAANPNGYTYGIGVTSFEPATKMGYTFLGWFDKASGGTEITSLSRTESANKRLYAHWKANNYEITYELDGGVNVAANPNGYTYGIGVTSFEPATKIGYTFLGWFDKVSGGTEITSLSRTETASKRLYAHWKANNYEITYELDGGVNGLNPTTYTYGVGVSSFRDATKKGYIFLGWFDAAIGGHAIADISTSTTGIQTLYARFKQDFTRIEVRPIIQTIAKNTIYSWHHTDHEPVFYDENNQIVLDNELWVLVDGQVYHLFDTVALSEGVHDITFTNVNPLLKVNPSNDKKAVIKEVTAKTTATILTKDAAEPAPIMVRYTDQSGKNLKPATVYNGKIGDKVISLAPEIEGYELLSLNKQINVIITDQLQTYNFVYQVVTPEEPSQLEGLSQLEEPSQLEGSSKLEGPVIPEETGPKGYQRLPETEKLLFETGVSKHLVNLTISIMLVGIASFLSWFLLSKLFVIILK